jgi:transcriptional regulator with XRE-family HTH domain
MTSEPTNPLLARQQVKATVRRMRKQARLDLDKAASLLDLSRSALSRMERGETSITVHLARSMMDLYDQYSPTLIANVRAARTRGWWRDFHFSADHYIGWESGASGIREVAVLRIPDLLQTEDYARALLVDDPSAERDLAAFKIRQDRLSSSPPSVQLSVIVDESALHNDVGGPDVMQAQLEHLRTTRPVVSIRVLPANTVALFNASNFRLLDFDHGDNPPIVFADTPMKLIKEDKPNKVALARRLFEDINNATLSLCESLLRIDAPTI